MNYNELYELLRKEKYSETLQQLDKKFIPDFLEYLKELRESIKGDSELFGFVHDEKKQFENSIAIFKSLILMRKKKLLNLVFVAAETGIMRRDYENMLDFEKRVFDRLVKAVEDGEKELSDMLNGKTDKGEKSKMIIFEEDVDEFIDMNGKVIGPFSKGELSNLNSEVCDILVSGGKARFVDES